MIMKEHEMKIDRERLQRRTLFVVVLSQIFGGAGLASGVTVGALLAQEMLGTDRFAGLPVALFTFGSAGAALVVGRLSQRFGRRTGLAAGFLTGGIGALGVVLAAVIGNIPLLLVSLLVYGAGTATNLQARYAGTDLALPDKRATAVSIALVMTTFGAVLGPNLVGVMGDVATRIGIPALAGPFLLAAGAFLAAGLVLLILLRPDPLLVARRLHAEAETAAQDQPEETHDRRGVFAGAFLMVMTQLVMVAVMTMTPVHMRHHGHGLEDVGMVIGLHIGAMYLPSLVTGVLVDKLGRTKMAIAAGVTLFASGLVAAFAPGDGMIGIAAALILLGIGWNFGLISGTAILIDATTTETRAKTQGQADVLIALSGASGGVLSGMIVAGTSYAALAIGGGVLALLLIPFVVRKSGGAEQRGTA
ncbi:MFS transporter [Exiguobacterium flavidum]|uniref:MFS transporter n=1 Tax=Exiguobacterium flavidum TaxID=2184695 RepID=UPI000DF75FCF|nr:MFS transporter [Exiguobacterium flavidum]